MQVALTFCQESMHSFGEGQIGSTSFGNNGNGILPVPDEAICCY